MTEATEKIFKSGDKFQMTGLGGEIKPVKIVDVAGNSARVICGSEKTTLPISFIKHLKKN
jgi:hypothetical protein